MRHAPLYFSLAAVCCLAGGPVGAHEDWPPSRVIELLRAREAAITALEASLSVRSEGGPDFRKLHAAMSSYLAAQAQMVGDIHRDLPFWEPRPEEQHWRLHWERPERWLCFFLGNPDAMTEQDRAVTWKQVFVDRANIEEYRLDLGEVRVGRQAFLPMALEVLGLGGHLEELNPLGRAAAGDYFLSRFVEEMYEQDALESCILEDDHIHLVMFRHLSGHPGRPAYRKTRLILDVSRALTPVEFEMQIFREFDGQMMVSTLSPFILAAWEDHEEVVAGVWLPRSLQVDESVHVLVPLDGNEFRPIMRDGKPALSPTGHLQIDPKSGVVEKFHSKTSLFTVESLRVNDSVGEHLVRPQYPDGTLVFDRRAEEFFQLEGTSALVDSAIRAPLDPYTGKKMQPTRIRTWVRSAIALGGVAIMLLVIKLVWLRTKERAT